MKHWNIWDEDIHMEDWLPVLQEEFPGKSEEDLLNAPECWQFVTEENYRCLEDEWRNLDIVTGFPILIIADLGLWNGRQPAYGVIQSGNIADCLRSHCSGDSRCHWYIDRWGDLVCDESHHDGTNHYLYRILKPTASGEYGIRIKNLGNKIMTKVITRKEISQYTNRLGDYIAAVYGWEIYRGKQVQKNV